MALEQLRASLQDTVVVRFGDYDYFVHPITDGIPLGRPEVLEEVVAELARLGTWHRVDKIVTAESMGFPLAAALSLRVRKPYVFIRKRKYGLPGEVSLPAESRRGEGRPRRTSLEDLGHRRGGRALPRPVMEALRRRASLDFGGSPENQFQVGFVRWNAGEFRFRRTAWLARDVPRLP